MDNLTIALPADLRLFVESQAVAHGYATPDGYVAAVLLVEQQRLVREHVDALHLESPANSSTALVPSTVS